MGETVLFLQCVILNKMAVPKDTCIVYGGSCTTMEYECVFVRIREILPIGVEVSGAARKSRTRCRDTA